MARALHLVTAVRQLSPRAPIRTRVVSRTEMLDRVKAQMRAEVPEAVARGNEEMLVACGVAPMDFDFETSVMDLLGAQLSGYYDPETQQLFVASDLGRSEGEATLVHELVHALQDQHFQLGQRVKFRPEASDELGAIHGLAEGDATSAMADAMLASRGLRATDLGDEQLLSSMREAMDQAGGMERVPAILKRSLLAPYLDGVALVHWARRQRGWESVDEVWRDPPASCEQLLHPEKLAGRERPEPVAVPAAPRDGPKSVLYQDVLGEQAVRLLVQEWLTDAEARMAAQGWSGDRVVVLCDADRCALAWHVRYDDRDAAGRGVVGFGAGVVAARLAGGRAAGLSGGDPERGSQVAAAAAREAVRSGQACQERPHRGPLAVARIGRDVVLVAGPYRRRGGEMTSAGRCDAALEWAAAVASQQ